jgi:small-conductance mechanosensitive channel/CRP-like cAMP-binding protein
MSIVASQLSAGIVIVACFSSWLALRRRPVWARLGCAALLLALLSVSVVNIVGSPLQPVFSGATHADRLWEQIILACWWLFAAHVVVETMSMTVFTRSFSGEGRLFSDLLAGIVYLAVLLTISSVVFGLSVGGLVATSGVIAIVLGLALQNTLADVFSGIAVGIEQPYAVGDLVWFDGATEGEVVEISWRSVQVRTGENDLATVPNSVVAKSRIINRSFPSPRRSGLVQFPCDRNIPPERVIELLRAAILLCPTVMEAPGPSCILARVGRHMNHYEVNFSVAQSSLLWQTKGALLREVLRQSRFAGIDAPGSAALAAAGAEFHACPTALLDIPLFEDLSPATREALGGHLLRRTLQPAEILFAEGATEASLFIVAQGVLELTRLNNGAALRIGRITSGDYIGEIGMLTGAPHGATVAALTRCIVFELHKEDVAPLLQAQPQMVRAFEASARRGQALLDRSVAASVGAEMASSGQLLERIRAFFHL